MPYLSKPCVWVPEVSTAQDKILRAIYVKICAGRGRPSAEFIAENPNYKRFIYTA